jgi:hypothetical protein
MRSSPTVGVKLGKKLFLDVPIEIEVPDGGLAITVPL